MKHQLRRALVSLLFVFAVISLVGCYTQFGTGRSERDGDYGGNRAEPTDTGYQSYDDSTAYTNNDASYDDYMYHRNRLGFSYYYPTIVVGAGFYDPWYWDPWYYGRAGWYSYYDPFLCGTAYPGLYAGYYYPRSWYNYPGYSGGYYGHQGGVRGHGAMRTFGNTRGGGGVRAVGGTRGSDPSYRPPASGGELPVGYRSSTGSARGGATPSAVPKVSTGRRGGEGGARGGSRPGAVSRGGNTRGQGGREGTRVGGSSAPPPRQASPPRDSGTGNRGGGERSGGGRSYTPPPQSAPSSPPSGGGAPSNTGSRGGSRR